MIKGLERQLNEAGKIKIGKKGKMITSAKGKEFRPPKKLDHFQLVTTEKNEEGDYIVDIDLQNRIKKSGNGLVNKNGCLVGLPIRLVYNSIDQNFPHRYVSYVSGKMSCHGDGEFSFKRTDDFTKSNPCPCSRIEPGYDKDDKCKPAGTLTCVLDEVDLIGQAHKFRTTSMNTIKGILGGIELISQATGGKIAWLPLMLTMNQKQTSTPGGISTTIYVVSICFRGDIDSLRQKVLSLISGDKQFLLEMDTISNNPLPEVDSDDEKEFAEEFFPSTIDKTDAIETEVKEIEEKVEPENVENEPDRKPVQEESSQELEPPEKMTTPAGTYAALYAKLIQEKDIDKAKGFAKRLMVGNLIYWLFKQYPDIPLGDDFSKPTILAMVNNVLESVLKASSENEEKKEPEKVPQGWDDSGPIKQEQAREIMKYKVLLEDEGILKPQNWSRHVNYFLTEEGDPVMTGNKLTTVQAGNFIIMLAKALNGDDIPF